MKSAIANNVKHIIYRKCFRQSAIAKKAGYDVRAFNNMLNGRKLITDVDVVKIVTCFDVPDIQFPTPGHPWSVETA
ncbi:hypothetical protein, partial [Enterocloster bolteae]|uniref:hypothetical protein n=1 Tax=Enterocloster bolteae TaxID=208479 RepID=UPI00210D7FAC